MANLETQLALRVQCRATVGARRFAQLVGEATTRTTSAETTIVTRRTIEAPPARRAMP
jgi:hypothetical protein